MQCSRRLVCPPPTCLPARFHCAAQLAADCLPAAASSLSLAPLACSPLLSEGDFEAKPSVLLLGQYSTGGLEREGMACAPTLIPAAHAVFNICSIPPQPSSHPHRCCRAPSDARPRPPSHPPTLSAPGPARLCRQVDIHQVPAGAGLPGHPHWAGAHHRQVGPFFPLLRRYPGPRPLIA